MPHNGDALKGDVIDLIDKTKPTLTDEEYLDCLDALISELEDRQREAEKARE